MKRVFKIMIDKHSNSYMKDFNLENMVPPLAGNKESCSKIISPYFTLVHQWKPRFIVFISRFFVVGSTLVLNVFV